MSESPPPKPPIPPIPPILRKTTTPPKRRILPILPKLPKLPNSRSLRNLRAKPQLFCRNFPEFCRKVLQCTELLFCVGRFLLRLMLLSLLVAGIASRPIRLSLFRFVRQRALWCGFALLQNRPFAAIRSLLEYYIVGCDGSGSGLVRALYVKSGLARRLLRGYVGIFMAWELLRCRGR